MLAEALGGSRGLLDSGLPTLVFIVGNVLGGVKPAVVAAFAAGLLLVALRLVRRETVQQAVGGLFGLAVAAFLALRLNGGDGSGFFLPGVVVSVAYAIAFTGSLVVGRPLVGVLVAALQNGLDGWRDDPLVRRPFAVATAGWAGIYALKAGVQGTLLYAGAGVTELGVVRLAMGYPLFLGGIAVTVVYLRRRKVL